MKRSESLIYFQNIVSCLPLLHQQRDLCKDITEYKPKYIDMKINIFHKWKLFKARALNINSPKKIKDHFAVD